MDFIIITIGYYEPKINITMKVIDIMDRLVLARSDYVTYSIKNYIVIVIIIFIIIVIVVVNNIEF
jgi:t-SNARE complex subunit (syntaxin)